MKIGLRMQEELNQFVRNDVWELAPRPENVHVIGTKWILKNKTDKDGEIIQNKSWLVAQGYTQVEGVDFDELNQPSCWLYSVPNLLVFQQLISLYLGGILVRVVSEIV